MHDNHTDNEIRFPRDGIDSSLVVQLHYRCRTELVLLLAYTRIFDFHAQ